MLERGQFAHVPHLYGTNSDEGSKSYLMDDRLELVHSLTIVIADNAPFGINTDSELRDYLLYQTGFNFPNSTITEIMTLSR